MANINWPATLPFPKAEGFTFAHKQMGNTLAFASGRRRVTQTRLHNTHNVVNANFAFTMTLEEYATFAEFYDTTWKALAPRQDALVFSVPLEGPFLWVGWPTTEVSLTRNDHTWEVSFGFEAHFPTLAPFFDFSTEESDAQQPLWPVGEFPLSAGASFVRESRDKSVVEDLQGLIRTTTPDANFVAGEVSTEPVELERVLRFLVWWRYLTSAGAKPFKLPASSLDLGRLNRKLATDSGYYSGKIVTPPKITFNGLYGTISLGVVIWPYLTHLTTVGRLVTDTGAIFTTNTGNHIAGAT